jgi:EAL domain-containing protein (putative c-di-GMP-specific phosphodiesterase class I)
VLTYTESYSETQRRRFDLNRTLTDAILSNHLFLVYQPIIETRTGRVESLEALARWNHPELGSIAPEEFIHLAEDSDRIVALGEWILYTACAEARSWGERDHPQKIAENVSINQLLSENFFSHVVDTLKQTDLPANRLQLEVTETLFNEENLNITLEKVKKLRQLGVEIHIDDFGTGYSSLSRLHQFPVNTIKIDRTFTANIHEQSVIIESAVMIAKRMNLKVIAEGVETLAQAQAVTDLGVDFIQGYYLAPPQIKAHLDSIEVRWRQG